MLSGGVGVCMSSMSSIRDRILDEMDPGEPYSARELAELLDESRRTVDYNLNQLASDGVIERKEHTQRDISYWIEPE